MKRINNHSYQNRRKAWLMLYKIHGQNFLKVLFSINILLTQKKGAQLSCKCWIGLDEPRYYSSVDNHAPNSVSLKIKP